MTFGKQIINFYKSIDRCWLLPEGIDLIYPFENQEILSLMGQFYNKYYNDKSERHFLFGINPGRLGAGMTGIPFTDPIRLENECGIMNNIKKKPELSSIFIYEMINHISSVKAFYNQFYVSSICSLGFTKDGRNYNYYDDPILYSSVQPYIIDSIEKQIGILCKRDKAFSLGQGKNFKIFVALNDKYGWFNEIIPLPHPRWIMQYKRKTKQLYLDEYRMKLT